MKLKKIAVFDSGVGGLTILREIVKYVDAEFIYYADSANVPYGNRTDEDIKFLSFEAMRFLAKYNPDLIIIACHTVSSISIQYLRKEFKIPIIGMVEPAAIKAAKVTKNLKIGLLGTSATVKRDAHNQALLRLNNKIKTYTQACPMLVQMIENNFAEKEIEKYLYSCLEPILSQKIDTLMLACTHYAILDNLIKKMTKGVQIISSEQITDEIALNLNLKLLDKIDPKIEFYSSKDPELIKIFYDKITKN